MAYEEEQGILDVKSNTADVFQQVCERIIGIISIGELKGAPPIHPIHDGATIAPQQPHVPTTAKIPHFPITAV
ncbi:hypothetical protein HDU67_008991 [Dinochytrium kinnereticum]|nr:hypothetical protein HDU67_008991 [Dinochytrium kinnereticum]